LNLYEVLVDPLLRYGFMRYGLAVAAIVGVTSAVLSCLLVVRRQALMGDAVAHAVLLGVAVGWVAAGHVGIFWGALIVGVLTGVAITFVERNSRVKLDAAMGIAFTFTFALGLAIISLLRPRGIDLFHVLLGNVLGVGPVDLALTAASGLLVIGVVVVLFKEFQLWSFDPVMAQASGLPVGALHYVFTALLSATIVAALQAVGLVLVIAMLITPGATAYLLADRLRSMMLIAAVIGLVSSVGGLYGSFYLDVASGPAIVIVASLVFVAVFLFAPRRGIVSRSVARRRTGRRTVEEDILKAVFTAEQEGGRTDTEALAGRTGHSPDDVTSRMDSLVRRGLLQGGATGAHSTSEGRDEAVRLVRAHRLIESYLAEAEGVPIDELHPEAERLEHSMSAEALEDIDRAMGRPAADPHGHPIPRQGARLGVITGRPLTDGRGGRVIMVRDDREDVLREMVALGILPMQEVTVVGATEAGMRVRIGGREAVLSEEVAARVFVTAEEGGDR